MNDNWIQITPSDFSWEREALRFLKERLPDHEPYRAWANFEFIYEGSIGEVDVLVVSPKGVFLVEIKSWPGVLRGDAGTWRRTPPGQTRERADDNPLLVTNRKAKRLKSLLQRQSAFHRQQVPFITPLVFLSNDELDCQLDPSGREGIAGLGRDPQSDAPIQRGGLPGIIDLVAKITPEEHGSLRRRRIDRPTSARIAQALEQAGVRPSQRTRRVGELQLEDLLDEGAGYQDFAAVHIRSGHAHRRVRIYGAPDADPVRREQITRAAQREFELLSAVQHPGILRALDVTEHELGPAIVFEHDPSEIRLDQYLGQDGASLSLIDRLALLRDLAETIASAHGHRLAHRALSPRSVLVLPDPHQPFRLRVYNWQTGVREAGTGTSSMSVRGTRHVEELIDAAASPYLAPETLTVPDPDPQLQDVFSLGAIAYHVFTGHPPATSLSAMSERLHRDGALEVSADLDGAGEYLAELVREATRADASQRTASVADFLDGLAAVEDDLTVPEPPDEPQEVEPLRARQGDVLAGYLIERRLGRGSTAVALLARDAGDQEWVLKLAADPDRNERVREEGELLARLRDRTIIAVRDSGIEVAGHAGIVLEYASEGTLAKHLQRQGRLSLGDLERWGGDLLSALTYLEREGVWHRDIKPENLGIVEAGARRQRHLVLMDFSLARAPADQLSVGTRPYLDPFLGARFGRPRWDPAGDRFAAAMVLHEMAAGSLPYWGSRSTDPRFTDEEATVDHDAFPREAAAALTEFFERALRRTASERFDTADDMERAWTRVFTALQSSDVAAATAAERAAARDSATRDTPVVALGLGSRALNALDRLSVLNVADLLSLSPMVINSLRGVGVDTRRELVQMQSELRKRLEHEDLPAARTPAEDIDQNLDTLARQLLPRRTSRNASTVDAVDRLLGLTAIPTAGPWPSQTEVAAARGVTRARVGQILGEQRERWAKLDTLTELRSELVERLQQLGGAAAATELESAVLASYSVADIERGPDFARAAVRAAVEVELASPEARLTQRRAGGRVLLSCAGEDAAERQEVLEYVVRLGQIADEIAQASTLLAPSQVLERLRRLQAPPAVSTLNAERLVHLAAAAAADAAVSARLELHPRELPAARALSLGRSAVLGAERIRPEEVRSRIASRFPQAQPLPDRPQLDDLLRHAGFDYTWNEQEGVYKAPEHTPITGLTSYESSLTRLGTAAETRTPRPAADPELVLATDFEQLLLDSKRDGGLLALMAYPQDLAAAGRELRRLEPTVIDLDERLIAALREAATRRRVRSWDVVLAADAAEHTSREWSYLTQLAAEAVADVELQITNTDGTVLLEHVGLLARYGQLGLFDRLRATVIAGGPLRTCWTLVPADDQSERPTVDGQPLPVLTDNEWRRIPRAWLKNVHRAQNREAA